MTTSTRVVAKSLAYSPPAIRLSLSFPEKSCLPEIRNISSIGPFPITSYSTRQKRQEHRRFFSIGHCICQRRYTRMYMLDKAKAYSSVPHPGGKMLDLDIMSVMPQPPALSYICQTDAIAIDETLFETFAVDSLMELAGLSCAEAIYSEAAGLLSNKSLPHSWRFSSLSEREGEAEGRCSILILCGPGNNGGDGLVAARHLYHFGGNVGRVVVWYPKYGKGALFDRLKAQMDDLGIEIATSPDFLETRGSEFDIVVDAIFGFSFRGWRGEGKDAPYDTAIAWLSQICGSDRGSADTDGCDTKNATSPSIVISIDLPSGWRVDGPASNGNGSNGDDPTPTVGSDAKSIAPPATGGDGSITSSSSAAAGNGEAFFTPDVLISLTLPKLCAKHFQGRHYVGGRFVPPKVKEKFGLVLPDYGSGSGQVVRIA